MGFEGNSDKNRESKPQQRKMEPIAQSSTKKREGLGGVVDGILSHSKKDITTYIIESVVLPAITGGIGGIGDIIINSLVEGVGEAFRNFGYSADTRKRNGDRASYSGYYKRDRGYSGSGREEHLDEHPTYDNIRVSTRGQADKVLDQLRDNISEDGYATVAQLFELVNRIPSYPNHNWGWTKLDSADWVRVNDPEYPYLLRFPKPKSLDNI